MRSILEATHRLYAAVAKEDEWPLAVQGLVDLLGGDHGFLVTYDAAQSRIVGAGIDDADLAQSDVPTEWMTEGNPVTPEALPAGVAITRAELISDRDFARSAYYNEIIRPLNGFHSVQVRQVMPFASFIVAVCRPPRQGNFDAEDTAKLQALLPHLTTAVELRHRLAVAEHRHDTLARLVEGLETGVLLVDMSAHPSLVNARAARIIAEADGLALTAGRLCAATPAATRDLRQSIAAVGCGTCAEGGRVRVERPSQRPPLFLRLLPIRPAQATVVGAPAPAVAIFITEPDAPPITDRVALAEVFRLTRREADVASLLAAGHDLEGIAARLGLGLGTVRHHLKAVFGKTGARTQAKLVARIRSFVDHGG